MIANHAPQLARRPPTQSVPELLTWAQEPLATAEIALIMQTTIEEARQTLTPLATWHPAGADGYWTLRRPPNLGV